MFTVAVRDHVMIAHRLRGDVFGPATRLHGATYVVTTEYRAAALDADGIVIDIELARRILDEALEPLRFRDLDALDVFAGRNTTTEVIAHHLHGRIAARLAGRFEGTLRVVLEESPVAWCAYEGPVR